MLLSGYVEDYLAYLKHERGATQSTCACYQAALRYFLRWLLENGYPEPKLDAFNTPALRRFLYHLSEKELRPRTIIGYFHPLRSMGEWLISQQVVTENPAHAIRLPKKDAARRDVTTEEEIKALLVAVERQRSKRHVALHRAVLSIFIFCGLRRQELLDLEVSDIDAKECSLLVKNGKGGKSRKVYAPDVRSEEQHV